MAFQVARLVAVGALVCAAAAIATPAGRVPLALRGLSRLLGRPSRERQGERVPVRRRVLAFALVLAAFALALA